MATPASTRPISLEVREGQNITDRLANIRAMYEDKTIITGSPFFPSKCSLKDIVAYYGSRANLWADEILKCDQSFTVSDGLLRPLHLAAQQMRAVADALSVVAHIGKASYRIDPGQGFLALLSRAPSPEELQLAWVSVINRLVNARRFCEAHLNEATLVQPTGHHGLAREGRSRDLQHAGERASSASAVDLRGVDDGGQMEAPSREDEQRVSCQYNPLPSRQRGPPDKLLIGREAASARDRGASGIDAEGTRREESVPGNTWHRLRTPRGLLYWPAPVALLPRAVAIRRAYVTMHLGQPRGSYNAVHKKGLQWQPALAPPDQRPTPTTPSPRTHTLRASDLGNDAHRTPWSASSGCKASATAFGVFFVSEFYAEGLVEDAGIGPLVCEVHPEQTSDQRGDHELRGRAKHAAAVRCRGWMAPSEAHVLMVQNYGIASTAHPAIKGGVPFTSQHPHLADENSRLRPYMPAIATYAQLASMRKYLAQTLSRTSDTGQRECATLDTLQRELLPREGPLELRGEPDDGLAWLLRASDTNRMSRRGSRLGSHFRATNQLAGLSAQAGCWKHKWQRPAGRRAGAACREGLPNRREAQESPSQKFGIISIGRRATLDHSPAVTHLHELDIDILKSRLRVHAMTISGLSMWMPADRQPVQDFRSAEISAVCKLARRSSRELDAAERINRDRPASLTSLRARGVCAPGQSNVVDEDRSPSILCHTPCCIRRPEFTGMIPKSEGQYATPLRVQLALGHDLFVVMSVLRSNEVRISCSSDTGGRSERSQCAMLASRRDRGALDHGLSYVVSEDGGRSEREHAPLEVLRLELTCDFPKPVGHRATVSGHLAQARAFRAFKTKAAGETARARAREFQGEEWIDYGQDTTFASRTADPVLECVLFDDSRVCSDDARSLPHLYDAGGRDMRILRATSNSADGQVGPQRNYRALETGSATESVSREFSARELISPSPRAAFCKANAFQLLARDTSRDQCFMVVSKRWATHNHLPTSPPSTALGGASPRSRPPCASSTDARPTSKQSRLARRLTFSRFGRGAGCNSSRRVRGKSNCAPRKFHRLGPAGGLSRSKPSDRRALGTDGAGESDAEGRPEQSRCAMFSLQGARRVSDHGLYHLVSEHNIQTKPEHAPFEFHCHELTGKVPKPISASSRLEKPKRLCGCSRTDSKIDCSQYVITAQRAARSALECALLDNSRTSGDDTTSSPRFCNAGGRAMRISCAASDSADAQVRPQRDSTILEVDAADETMQARARELKGEWRIDCGQQATVILSTARPAFQEDLLDVSIISGGCAMYLPRQSDAEEPNMRTFCTTYDSAEAGRRAQRDPAAFVNDTAGEPETASSHDCEAGAHDDLGQYGVVAPPRGRLVCERDLFNIRNDFSSRATHLRRLCDAGGRAMRTLRASSDSADERLRPRHDFYALEIGLAGEPWGSSSCVSKAGGRADQGKCAVFAPLRARLGLKSNLHNFRSNLSNDATHLLRNLNASGRSMLTIRAIFTPADARLAPRQGQQEREPSVNEGRAVAAGHSLETICIRGKTETVDIRRWGESSLAWSVGKCEGSRSAAKSDSATLGGESIKPFVDLTGSQGRHSAAPVDVQCLEQLEQPRAIGPSDPAASISRVDPTFGPPIPPSHVWPTPCPKANRVPRLNTSLSALGPNLDPSRAFKPPLFRPWFSLPSLAPTDVGGASGGLNSQRALSPPSPHCELGGSWGWYPFPSARRARAACHETYRCRLYSGTAETRSNPRREEGTTSVLEQRGCNSLDPQREVKLNSGREEVAPSVTQKGVSATDFRTRRSPHALIRRQGSARSGAAFRGRRRGTRRQARQAIGAHG